VPVPLNAVILEKIFPVLSTKTPGPVGVMAPMSMVGIEVTGEAEGDWDGSVVGLEDGESEGNLLGLKLGE